LLAIEKVKLGNREGNENSNKSESEVKN